MTDAEKTGFDLPQEIAFLREKKYKAVEVLGKGACGITVRLYDSEIDANFVCKKFSPLVEKLSHPALHSELLRRFKDEARILFRLNHPCIVRVYNYYDYSDRDTAYLLMEYVEGSDILDFVERHPERAGEVFLQVVSGFANLENAGVLHRDIRPTNILVTDEGVVKIIDFGFGKLVNEAEGLDEKSISLNWWCELPEDFDTQRYDFATEVYFVGKLFEKAIVEFGLRDFPLRELIRTMCRPNPIERPQGFSEVNALISKTDFSAMSFAEEEKWIYREFAEYLCGVFSTIGPDAKFKTSPETIVSELRQLFQTTMLEDNVPEPVKVARIFVSGPFRFFRHAEFPVESLKKFLDLLVSASQERKSILINNLIARLGSIDKAEPDHEDEIPF